MRSQFLKYMNDLNDQNQKRIDRERQYSQDFFKNSMLLNADNRAKYEAETKGMGQADKVKEVMDSITSRTNKLDNTKAMDEVNNIFGQATQDNTLDSYVKQIDNDKRYNDMMSVAKGLDPASEEAEKKRILGDKYDDYLTRTKKIDSNLDLLNSKASTGYENILYGVDADTAKSTVANELMNGGVNPVYAESLAASLSVPYVKKPNVSKLTDLDKALIEHADKVKKDIYDNAGTFENASSIVSGKSTKKDSKNQNSFKNYYLTTAPVNDYQKDYPAFQDYVIKKLDAEPSTILDRSVNDIYKQFNAPVKLKLNNGKTQTVYLPKEALYKYVTDNLDPDFSTSNEIKNIDPEVFEKWKEQKAQEMFNQGLINNSYSLKSLNLTPKNEITKKSKISGKSLTKEQESTIKASNNLIASVFNKYKGTTDKQKVDDWLGTNYNTLKTEPIKKEEKNNNSSIIKKAFEKKVNNEKVNNEKVNPLIQELNSKNGAAKVYNIFKGTEPKTLLSLVNSVDNKDSKKLLNAVNSFNVDRPFKDLNELKTELVERIMVNKSNKETKDYSPEHPAYFTKKDKPYDFDLLMNQTLQNIKNDKSISKMREGALISELNKYLRQKDIAKSKIDNKILDTLIDTGASTGKFVANTINQLKPKNDQIDLSIFEKRAIKAKEKRKSDAKKRHKQVTSRNHVEKDFESLPYKDLHKYLYNK